MSAGPRSYLCSLQVNAPDGHLSMAFFMVSASAALISTQGRFIGLKTSGRCEKQLPEWTHFSESQKTVMLSLL